MGAPLLLALSCTSGDDDASAGAARTESGGRPDEETTTTVAADEPSAAKPDQVIPYIEDLLSRYDEAVGEIVADPSIAGDPRDATVEEFLSLFEPGNEFADGSLEGWVSQAEQGITLQPASPDQGINTTSLEGPPTRIDDDTLLYRIEFHVVS